MPVSRAADSGMGKSPKRILILGDSLAGDRPDGIATEERWPAQVARRLGSVEIVNRSRGSSTTSRLRAVKDLGTFDLAIIQLGVVDAAPRYFSWIEQRALARLPSGLRSRVINWFKTQRTQSLKRRYVQPEAFLENLQGFAAPGVPVIALKILPAGEKYKQANSEAQASFDKYNSLMDKVADGHPGSFFTVAIEQSEVDAMTLDDGYHLNKAGHRAIAERIASTAEALRC